MNTAFLPLSLTLAYDGGSLVLVRQGDDTFKVKENTVPAPAPTGASAAKATTDESLPLGIGQFVAYTSPDGPAFGYITGRPAEGLDTYTIARASTARTATHTVKRENIKSVTVTPHEAFKPGMRVRLVREVFRDPSGSSYGWEGPMSKHIGGVPGYVKYVETARPFAVQVGFLNGESWYVGREALELLPEKVELPAKGALVSSTFTEGAMSTTVLGEVYAVEPEKAAFKIRGWRYARANTDTKPIAATSFSSDIWNGNPLNYSVIDPYAAASNFHEGDIVKVIRPWDIGNVTYSPGMLERFRDETRRYARVSTVYRSGDRLESAVKDAPLLVRTLDDAGRYYLSPFAVRKATKEELSKVFPPGRLVMLLSRPEHVTKKHWSSKLEGYIGFVARVIEFDLVGGEVSSDYPIKVEVFRSDGSRDTVWWPVEAVTHTTAERASNEPVKTAEKPTVAAGPAATSPTPEKVPASKAPEVKKPSGDKLCKTERDYIAGSAGWSWKDGDRVIIEKRVTAVDGEDMRWVADMDATVGKTGTIIASEESELFNGTKRYMVALDGDTSWWYAGDALCALFEADKFPRGTKVRAVRRDRYWSADRMEKLLEPGDAAIMTISDQETSSRGPQYTRVYARDSGGTQWVFAPMTLQPEPVPVPAKK